MPCADLRVLFVAAAGPRRGFGHLVRCRSLARAMGVRPLTVVRGGRRVVDAALVLGCDVVMDARRAVIRKLDPDVLVVDDPIARSAAAWIAAGRRAGCLVVSIHDLGIGCLDADLVVDGSLARTARATRGRTLSGARYAVLDPALVAAQSPGPRAPRTASAQPRALPHGTNTRVLISLGGGPRAQRAAAIAQAIGRLLPDASIRIVGGFMPELTKSRGAQVMWVNAPRGLGDELARADVAVLGGGVSLYEACALGVPAVAVPVTRAQEPTVAAFLGRQAALGAADVHASPDAIAAQAERLVRDHRLRKRIAGNARQIVDGRGAGRVANAIAAIRAEPHHRTPAPAATDASRGL